MGILKKPYEISLWEDILVFVYENGAITEEKIEDGHGPVVNQYYKERKICIIGSDTMDTPLRATQGKLVQKVNGENILTFNMYSHYYDEDADTYFNNPFINLLINERKIKLRYGALGAEDTEWYDLVIKNIQENSETKTYSYTAKSLFINELSKSGFNLEFDPKLENNMGNVETLAERILDESDWQLRHSGEILKQTTEEPLYYIQINRDIDLKNMEDENETIFLPKGSYVYAFYSNIVNEQSYVQFLYANKYEEDDDHIITNSPNWYLDGVEYENGIPDFVTINDRLQPVMTVSDSYRGKRLVRKVKTLYDVTIDKYVNVYNDGTQELYGYTEKEYISPASVRSYITNPNSFDSQTGWEIGRIKTGETISFPKLEVVSVPDVRDVTYDDILAQNVSFISCLKLNITDTNQVFYNSGIVYHRHNKNGFIESEEYVFRIKYGQAGSMGSNGAKTLVDTDIDLVLSVKEYELIDGEYVFGDSLFESVIESNSTYSTPDYKITRAKCKKTLTYAEMIKMTNTLGFFVQASGIGTIYNEDIQFFPYMDNGQGAPLLPNEIYEGEVRTIYCYYIPNKDYKNIDEVNFVYRDSKPAKFLEVYNDNTYEKIRSITASESNRFNLLQELCEIFECWIKFEIEHNPQTGEILLDENYRQKKWVSFHEYIGKDNYSGFKYGINLKSIQRTVESEAIVSKMIVKNNSNEFATDGFCSIARATENPNGENFLLDFSYYIQQGLLGMSEVTNDLYLDINGFIGYYKKLKQINEKRNLYIEEQSGLLTDISEYQAAFQTYDISYTEAEKALRDKIVFVKTLTGYSLEELMNDKNNVWWKNDQLISTTASIGRLKSIINNHKKLAETAEENLNKSQKRFDELNRILTSRDKSDIEERLLVEKEELHGLFYKKYSRFLQEGSWISEDYVDDNLYYLDSQSTLHTSSQPKVTYNIAVLELSQLEGFENYVFALGDKTTIEDTEFFGWTWIDGVQTPYKEEIVVTEMTTMLDSPEQNQIKVQNYKTQFEDLFQRMAATTQSVEYSTGQYQKVSGIIESDGTINIVTLQNSIANNALTLQNAKDQSVIWDETGITTTSVNNPSEIVRIVSGGVFLSVDGGLTWNTGITGKGINASYITSGQLNVEEVNILNGAFPSFRWDNTGISAYEFNLKEQTGEVSNFNYSKFVRLDQYGLYGINGYSNFNSATRDEDGLIGEDKIWKHSNFALTWKGFQIKSNHESGGYISITSNNDLQVFDGNGNEYVKIGLLGETNDKPVYGLRLNDESGNTVLEQSSEGKVWIKNEIKIGSENTSTVSIGYLGEYRDDTNISEVIHAGRDGNQDFIVYEDGVVIARKIYALGGQIGGLEIESFPDPNYEVIIESETGAVFKNDSEIKILTARLYKGKNEITEGLSYQWYKFQTLLENETSQTIEVAAIELDDTNDQATYYCAITVDGA